METDITRQADNFEDVLAGHPLRFPLDLIKLHRSQSKVCTINIDSVKSPLLFDIFDQIAEYCLAHAPVYEGFRVIPFSRIPINTEVGLEGGYTFQMILPYETFSYAFEHQKGYIERIFDKNECSFVAAGSAFYRDLNHAAFLARQKMLRNESEMDKKSNEEMRARMARKEELQQQWNSTQGKK